MAMADLMVKLGLDGSRFSAGVKSAEQGVKNFSQKLGNIGTAMKAVLFGSYSTL